MKILLLSDINSAHIRRWGEALVREGVDLGIFSLNAPEGDWPQEQGIRVYSAGVSVSKTRGRLFSKVGYLFRSAEVMRAVESFRPDIIHAHYASSYGHLARRSGRPYLVSVWGTDVFDFPYRNPFNRRILVACLNGASRIMATGKALADEVRKLCGREAIVIPFGVDTERFKPRPRDGQERPFTLIVIKSLEKTYGIDLAIGALPRLGDDIRLIVAGRGSQETALKALARTLGVEDRVAFLGWVEGREVPALLDRADCYLNPSRWESFGVSILEAMACGVPVIAARTHGSEEIIESEKSGLLIPVDGQGELVEAIRRIIHDEALRDRLAAGGLTRAREHYAWDSCVRRMMQVYREAAA